MMRPHKSTARTMKRPLLLAFLAVLLFCAPAADASQHEPSWTDALNPALWDVAAPSTEDDPASEPHQQPGQPPAVPDTGDTHHLPPSRTSSDAADAMRQQHDSGAPLTQQQQQERLDEVYDYARARIARVRQHADELQGASTTDRSLLRSALDALAAAETRVHDWGSAIAHLRKGKKARTQPDQGAIAHTAELQKQGVQSLRSALDQLRVLLPKEATEGLLDGTDTPSAYILQSMQCLEEVAAGLDKGIDVPHSLQCIRVASSEPVRIEIEAPGQHFAITTKGPVQIEVDESVSMEVERAPDTGKLAE